MRYCASCGEPLHRRVKGKVVKTHATETLGVGFTLRGCPISQTGTFWTREAATKPGEAPAAVLAGVYRAAH